MTSGRRITATVSRTTRGRPICRRTGIRGGRIVSTIVHGATARSGIRIAARLHGESAIHLLVETLVLACPGRHVEGGLWIIVGQLVGEGVVAIIVIARWCLLVATT
jgi:hypothetical protein